jgi:hypothetical protein
MRWVTSAAIEVVLEIVHAGNGVTCSYTEFRSTLSLLYH